jgi:hypothetical protein
MLRGPIVRRVAVHNWRASVAASRSYSDMGGAGRLSSCCASSTVSLILVSLKLFPTRRLGCAGPFSAPGSSSRGVHPAATRIVLAINAPLMIGSWRAPRLYAIEHAVDLIEFVTKVPQIADWATAFDEFVSHHVQPGERLLANGLFGKVCAKLVDNRIHVCDEFGRYGVNSFAP